MAKKVVSKKVTPKKRKKAVKAKPKAKMGPPAKSKGINWKLVESLYKKGATDKEVAEGLMISQRTLHRWKKDHPDLCHLKDWKDEADNVIEKSMYERAKGYSHPEEKIFNGLDGITRADTVKHYPPDTAAGKFWLTNRRPKEWKEKTENTETHKFKFGDIDVSDLTKDEMLGVMMKKVTLEQIQARRASERS